MVVHKTTIDSPGLPLRASKQTASRLSRVWVGWLRLVIVW